MMSFITHLGSNALSDFRRKALINQLQVNDVRAQWVHFIALQATDSPQDFDQQHLERLLAYGPDYSEDGGSDDEHVTTWFIQPRRGTISPWSSKATSIAMVCGYGDVVKRIERGMIVKIVSDGSFDEERAKKELHDKMTQDLDTSMPDLEVMFGQR